MTGERKLKNIASYRCTEIGYWVTLSAQKFPVGRGQKAASRSGPLPSPTRLDGKSKASSVRAYLAPCTAPISPQCSALGLDQTQIAGDFEAQKIYPEDNSNWLGPRAEDADISAKDL
jgi:hypothetical protein